MRSPHRANHYEPVCGMSNVEVGNEDVEARLRDQSQRLGDGGCRFDIEPIAL